MNKSKFLKKSLALLLALMLVFAMIPLSASAAPSDKFTPAGASATAEVTDTEQGWNMVFPFSSSLPTIRFETEGKWETVEYVTKSGATDDYNGTPIQLWEDSNGNPAPLTIRVTNTQSTGEQTTEHVITWTMEDPATEAYVTSATIGRYAGQIDNDANTIHFTLPFGYMEKLGAGNNATANFSVTGAVNSAPTVSISAASVATNKQAGAEVSLEITAQDQYTDVTYTITVEEEPGLTSISIGGYEGEFVLDSNGYETGTININVPSNVTAADLDDAVVEFTVGSDYTGIMCAPNGERYELVNGESYDFSGWGANAGKILRLTNADGQRDYTLRLVRDNQDTAIQSFTAQVGSGMEVDGTVDGENLNVTVPSTSDLTQDIVLNFVGPRSGVGGGANATISVVGATPAIQDSFDANGEASLTLSGYTSPLRLQVTSANGTDTAYAYYTLTITKAEAANNDPRVTSAKLTLGYGTDNATEYVGVIDNTAETITFSNIPYATLDNKIVRGTTTVYSFAKTSLTTISDTLNSATFEDGATVTVTSDNNTVKTYTVVFQKAAAQTGKSISSFILSEADNENLMDYNNNKTFTVTPTAVSGATNPDHLNVTLPTNHAGLYADFTLSQGAKLYSVANINATTFTKVEPYDGITGDEQSGVIFAVDTNTNSNLYFVADESLVYLIENGSLTGKTFDYVRNTYGSNMVVYQFNVTESDRSLHRLTSTLSADDGLVTSEFTTTNGTELDLTVPYSYAADDPTDAKEFFFDFTVSPGATLNIVVDSQPNSVIYSGGSVDYNTTTGEYDPDSSNWTGFGDAANNIAFKVAGDATNGYNLYFGGGTGVTWYALDGTTYHLQVIAENGTDFTEYTIGDITVADAETEANITSLTANGVSATVNQSTKQVTVNLPFGTNLGQVELGVSVSRLASYTINNAAATATMIYDLTRPITIEVMAENYDSGTGTGTGTRNVYTLTANLGEMFSDVAENQWYYDYVLEAANLGIVAGYPDGTFKPQNNVTRAEFAVMTVRMLGVDEDSLVFTTTPFTDVNDSTYYAAAIEYCSKNGLIGGDGNGKFRPNDPITRQEAAKIIAEALELTDNNAEGFNDSGKISAWAQNYVDLCQAAGIFEGNDQGNFNPTNYITRAETAKVMVISYNNK